VRLGVAFVGLTLVERRWLVIRLKSNLQGGFVGCGGGVNRSGFFGFGVEGGGFFDYLLRFCSFCWLVRGYLCSKKMLFGWE